MSYNVASIDVHKKLLVVVVADVADPDAPSQWRRFGTGWEELRQLQQWLLEVQVVEAVMESTAQYWKPVWMALEAHMKLHLAQAHSNRAPKGRKSDLADAQRLWKRFVAGELQLSFVPPPEQRQWRTLTRGRLQKICRKVAIQNQIESLLEEASIKLSSVISDVLGASGRRILRALACGETNPQALAELGDRKLKCDRQTLADALTGSVTSAQQLLLRQSLDEVEALDKALEEINQLCAALLNQHQDAVLRFIEVPGIGALSAQEIVAEIGPTAAAFPSGAQLASWVGVCPGSEQSAGHNRSSRTAKGNRFLRRLLCQAAQAAVRTEGSHLQWLFKRLLVRLGYGKAIWAIAHRLCRIIWNILHQGSRFVEGNPTQAVQRSIRCHLRALRRLGYDFSHAPSP